MSKIAALWARVSTSDQASLPDQIARAREKLESEEYLVPADRVLAVDWNSLNLFDCPEFQRLYGWVKRKEVSAIGMLDRDRLQAEPAQRLAFLAECREEEVEWVLCQVLPMLEGDWGDLIEHVHTIAKKQQVLWAKLGAKDGLHDKVVRDRKPISRHRLLGYNWDGDLNLKPNQDWPVLKLILDLALKGASLFAIGRELEKRGILTIRGAASPFPERLGIVHSCPGPDMRLLFCCRSLPPRARSGRGCPGEFIGKFFRTNQIVNLVKEFRRAFIQRTGVKNSFYAHGLSLIEQRKGKFRLMTIKQDHLGMDVG